MVAALIDTLASFHATRGPTLIAGSDLIQFFKMALGSTSGITALAGGGIPGATQLNLAFNEVDTVATTADSAMLPPAVAGSFVLVINNGANTLDVYNSQGNVNNGGAADTITPHGSVTPNAATTAITIATGVCNLFVCAKLGSWKQVAVFS